MIGIYKITSPSGKIYIGQSRDIEKRFNQYKGIHCKEQPILYNSLRKYGVENHVFEVIEECEIIELNEREYYWQIKYNCVGKKGLNCIITNPKDKVRILSDSTREKMSDASKGRVFSEETRKKLSDALKGELCYMWNRKPELHPMWNKKHTQETKMKMSIIQKEVMRNKVFNYINHRYIILDTYTGVYYYSVRELDSFLNIGHSYLSRLIKRGDNYYSDRYLITK